MVPEDKSAAPLKDKFIYIVGPRRLQNELMLFFLEQKTGATCAQAGDVLQAPAVLAKNTNHPHLILWDCLEKDPKIIATELASFDNTTLSRDYVALLNLHRGWNIEEEVLERGIRGFFYVENGIEQLQKGVVAILSGELWVSRGIMSRFVLGKRGYYTASGKDTSLLTRREIEILSMISAGATNEEIANNLYISPNTVKTHIYNIFKKIKVPNRLQAALWAAQNL
ncbi:MAG: LuxR C-terminal-related transcriptional regulator [Desulfobacteraceae bacterium]|jgi:DNA-binding NarL/FixJ family response regulator